MKKAPSPSESEAMAALAVPPFFGELLSFFAGFGHLSLKCPFSPLFQQIPHGNLRGSSFPLDHCP